MSLSVSFPADIEAILRQRALALGKDVNVFVREIVFAEVASIVSDCKRQESHVEFMQRLDAMIQRHGIRNGHFDDSRESIYAGRGE